MPIGWTRERRQPVCDLILDPSLMQVFDNRNRPDEFERRLPEIEGSPKTLRGALRVVSAPIQLCKWQWKPLDPPGRAALAKRERGSRRSVALN